MAAKKTSKSVNKTKYVKSLPATMSAKEVVDKAKVDGIILTTNYVYTIRNKAQKSSSGPKVAKKRGRPVGSTNKVHAGAAPAAAASHTTHAAPAARATSSASHTASSSRGHESELYRLIERIVEEKVRSVLNARFGALLK